ncbi:hypothetical protein CEF21_13315 [Bacillus sp. FJAT-42376]|uniref:hypothetical protein n=1 Tax=Bacillus sp. FJAT-42376 TaxID=2014076 RepID=UPI000F4D71FA|nr:hypothetical protein [Bacillus sp. FJAT-42376]AZB43202.1 hypothetical protein CEF21_13315 [Bacillus sp. FJAT-42376]
MLLAVICMLGIMSCLSALLVKRELEKLFYKGKSQYFFHLLNLYFVSLLISFSEIVFYKKFHVFTGFTMYFVEMIQISLLCFPFYMITAWLFEKHMKNLKKYDVRGNVLIIKPKYLSRKQLP